MASEAGNSANAVDDVQSSLQKIHDFLDCWKALQVHEGPSHISKILNQLTDLQQAHDKLLRAHKSSEEKFERDILASKKADEDARKKALKDYTEESRMLGREKEQLFQENVELKKSVQQHIAATAAAESNYNAQCKQIDALRQELGQSKESQTAAVREVHEINRKVNGMQQNERKLNECMNQRDLAEAKLKKEVSKAQEEAQIIKREKEKLAERFEKVQSYISSTTDEPLSDLIAELDAVWQDSLKLARSAAAGDISESSLKDPFLWQNVTKPATGLPLPRSNSAGAKSIRALLILSVMAATFVRHIFTSTYLLPEAGELDKLLRILAEKSTSQECFARRVLLQISSQDESRMIEHRVNCMTEEVVTSVQKFIPYYTLDNFKLGLEGLVKRSTQTWLKFQRSKIHFTATCDFDEEENGLNCKILKLSSENNESLYETDLSPTDNTCIPVFPQVLSVDDVEDKPAFPGVAVVRSQLAHIEEEFRAERAASTATTRRRTTPSQARPRQYSYRSASNGFLGRS